MERRTAADTLYHDTLCRHGGFPAAIMALPAWQAWRLAAEAEPWVIEADEA